MFAPIRPRPNHAELHPRSSIGCPGAYPGAGARYWPPPLTNTVLRCVKSWTSTRPRTTRTSEPSHRSTVSQTVPRTVAELYRACVRNLPVPSPQSERTTVEFFFRFAFFGLSLSTAAIFRAAPQAVAKFPPARRRSVKAVREFGW